MADRLNRGIIRLSPSPTLGGQLGEMLSGGLRSILEAKTQQLAQKQKKSGYESLGFSPEEAQALSGMDPSIVREIVKGKISEPKKLAQQQFLESQGFPSGLIDLPLC